MGGGTDMGADAGVDSGPQTGLCQECVADDQCPEGSECVPFGEATLCLERVANEFAICPRTFEAAELATRPGRYYCLPTEGCCIDEDDDGYGEGVFCDGPDCNDADELVHPDADELCNGDDDDCDTLADNMPIDCVQQGCRFNGTRYESSPGAACSNGTCEQVTVTSCGRYTCIGGMENGDVCAGSCEVNGVENDDLCIESAHCDAGVCVDDLPDGSACTVDSDCRTNHCENGFCCSGGTCCAQDSNCPGYPGVGVICSDRPMCQGTIGSVSCGADFQCVALNGAPNDSGCTSSIEASNCGPYPSVFCAGTTDQTAPSCATSCNVDADCDANAHCDNNLCLLDLPDGNACDENSDCTSSHCQNNFCCSGGDCCAMASQCPASYSSASVCTDAATCQGTRSDATCVANVCGTMAGIQDDTGCGTMTVADTCASFPSVFCNGMPTQTRPPCGSTCTLDSQCDMGSHCDSVCIPNIPDGGVCDEDSDCVAGHCQNGYCCASGVCCSTAANCPASFRSPSACGNTTTCQGTRSDATCTMSQCGTVAGVPDDSGCNTSSVSSNCGTYPSVTCNGAVDQTAPVCATSCTVDGDCDANAHCDNGQCLLDVANGEVCDENSDCTSSHCMNGFCCASGDCCATPTNCPASYRSAATCTTQSTCQGTRTDATCSNNQCGTTAPIDDDRGCTAGSMALDCDLNPPQYCTGTETQVPPVCAAACTQDSECIASAHCDTTCVADLPNGSSCDEDSDCIAGHCANGFCCATGDCCSTAANCPASYSTAPVCNTAATCQGTRSNATCSASNQCGTISGVEDDSACDNLVVANTCGFFPSVTCNGQPVQAPPTCSTGCTTDADCDANAHCDGGLCLPDLTDGNSCDEASDCISGHCQNDRCCASGDCCSTASNCPASYRSAPLCSDPATCQGSRSDAVCAGNICGTTTNVPDDTACNAGVLASSCGPYPSRFCNGLASQVAPVCGSSCSGNGDCDVDAHCSGGLCVPDLPDGGSCSGLGAAACTSGICNNGFCCSGGTCCSTATDCPGSFRRSPACDNAAMCQGTRDDAACVAFSCATVPNVPDDTACSAVTVANLCGPYPTVFCNGAADQMAPACSAMCSADGDCDANAHCDSNLCTPDLADGSTCDEPSDCVSGHCSNNRCCSGGVCCSSAAECPAAMFTVAPVCDTAAACDGHRNDAVCSGFVCSMSPEIDDDSACTAGTLANACGTYADRFCNGSATQSAPACGTSCTNDSQCDTSANCMGGMCVSDGANGDACSANSQCMSNHCQNGFCCATGDCCSTASDCGGYGSAPACDSPSTCQGTRDDAVCTAAKQCSTTANVPDDSACTSGTLANGCGNYTNLMCNGAVSQTAPMCPSSCTNSSQCDAGAFCGMGICQPLRTQGQTCSITSDCAGGLACADGVCCNNSCGGLCMACNVAGNVGTCSPIPAGQDPINECGMVPCTGWFSGWGGTNSDQCFTAQNAPATAVDCNGAGGCEGAPQVCPAQPPSTMVLDCDNLCQAKNTSTCVNQVAPVCNSVTPSPANQTCNLGVCTQSLARCMGGVPQNCPIPSSHPSYNPNDICDGLDNDCDGMVDDGAVALCNLPNANESCGGMSGCQVASCTNGYLDANSTASDGCECLPESISVNSCAAATSAAIQYTLTEGMSGTITGNLDLMADGDWYRVVMNNSATEGYRPQVTFTGTVSSDVVFDVYQNDCSTLAQHTGRAGTSCLGTSGQPRNITQYDLNANERTTECAPAGSNGTACNSAPSRTFFIHVHRAQSLAPTCTPYTLQVRNGT
ncbi:MAG: hypothetical protein R3B40_26260 [Polyangiales bacterium]|nr:hypothetical protein [Myxococcales bacterium]